MRISKTGYQEPSRCPRSQRSSGKRPSRCAWEHPGSLSQFPRIFETILAVRELGTPEHLFLASMAAYVGLDPRTDINWVFHPLAEAGRLLAEGKIDAWMAAPPFAQQLRAKQIGHLVVNMSSDRPWSQ